MKKKNGPKKFGLLKQFSVFSALFAKIFEITGFYLASLVQEQQNEDDSGKKEKKTKIDCESNDMYQTN